MSPSPNNPIQPNHFKRIWSKLEASLPTLGPRDQAIIYNNMRNNAQADVDFFVLITLSAIIAFYGLLQNSGAVIIGAMLVAPLMSPMIAMAHAIVMGNGNMLITAAKSTIAGVFIAISIATILTWFLPNIPPGNEILSRTHPTLLDMIIALASGAAAAYALGRKEVAAALPGVAIAAALVPPLCVVGYGLGSGHWGVAGGAALLFLTNLAAITLSGAIMFLLLGFQPLQETETADARNGFKIAWIGLLIVLIPLTFTTVSIFNKSHRESLANTILLDKFPKEQVEIEDIYLKKVQDRMLVSFTAYLYKEGHKANVIEKIRKELSDAMEMPVSLQVRIIQSSRLVK